MWILIVVTIPTSKPRDTSQRTINERETEGIGWNGFCNYKNPQEYNNF